MLTTTSKGVPHRKKGKSPLPPLRCSTCPVRSACIPKGLSRGALAQFESIVVDSRSLKHGEALFREGDSFSHLYALLSGALKTSTSHHDGRLTVVGMHLAGDILGLDGITGIGHILSATALDDSRVCVISYEQLLTLCSTTPLLHARVLKIMSAQMVRDSRKLMLLGTLNADQRLAEFLLDIADRCRKQGYSANEFQLPTTRSDIGDYLGISLETVSRTLSKFKRAGLIAVRGREISILDRAALRAL